MQENFEWDEAKNKQNIKKHGVSFKTACRIFEGPVLTLIDDRYDYGEVREISIGVVDKIAVLTVVHTDRNGAKRLISARLARRDERKKYETTLQKRADA